MYIKVDRVESNSDASLSKVYIDDVLECYGLEDEKRVAKVVGETRIPAGKYSVGLRTTGGTNKKYLERFPTIHKGMLHVRNVPGFEYILIHIGNTDADTGGCLLLGQSHVDLRQKYTLLNSKDAYESFYRKVVASAANGTLTIEYIDSDNR